MALKCSACIHDKVREINDLLVAGTSLRNVAKRFSLSPSALFRHQSHIPASAAQARAATEIMQADSLMAKITQLEQEARRLGQKAEACGDVRAALAAVRELVRIVELLAKIQGSIQEPGGKVTVVVQYVDKQVSVASAEAKLISGE